MTQRRHQQTTGFTLIEVLIAVAIVGILVSVAYPTYLEHVRETRREDARGALLENAQYLERQKTLSGAFDVDQSGSSVDKDDLTDDLPRPKVPANGTSMYDVSVTAVDGNSFTLQADPENEQASDPCGTLTLNQAGAWSSSGSGSDCP